MQKYARLSEDYVVIETISTDRDISEIFEPWLAEQFVKCPDYVEQQWTYDPLTGNWSAPAPPPKPEPYYVKQLSRVEFLSLFTQDERISIRQAAIDDAIIYDMLTMLDLSDSVNVEDKELIANILYLVKVEKLTQERADVILKGKLITP